MLSFITTVFCITCVSGVVVFDGFSLSPRKVAQTTGARDQRAAKSPIKPDELR